MVSRSRARCLISSTSGIEATLPSSAASYQLTSAFQIMQLLFKTYPVPLAFIIVTLGIPHHNTWNPQHHFDIIQFREDNVFNFRCWVMESRALGGRVLVFWWVRDWLFNLLIWCLIAWSLLPLPLLWLSLGTLCFCSLRWAWFFYFFDCELTTVLFSVEHLCLVDFCRSPDMMDGWGIRLKVVYHCVCYITATHCISHTS